LAVATLLTLVFLPALYVTWFGISCPADDRHMTKDYSGCVALARSCPSKSVPNHPKAVDL